jgi:hypothetical protein
MYLRTDDRQGASRSALARQKEGDKRDDEAHDRDT